MALIEMTEQLCKQLRPGDLVQRIYNPAPFRNSPRWAVVTKERNSSSFWFHWLGEEGTDKMVMWDHHYLFRNFFIRNGIKHTS